MASDHSSAVLNYGSVASAAGTSHVMGGTSVQPGAWPGIVSIQATWANGTWHMCTGVLLSSQWVLTVAHCFARGGDISTWEVVLGAIDLSQLGPEAAVRHIQRLLVHRHYVPATARNDIALLELEQPVECSDYIQLGCVPDASLRVSELKSCYIAGWNFARGEFPCRMCALGESWACQGHRLGTLGTRTEEKTLGWERGANPGMGGRSQPWGWQQPTAASEPSLLAQGDSGGPLVCKDNRADYFWLVGMNSWGKGCDRARHPGVYTSTQHFYNWILLQTGLSPAERAGPAPEPVVTLAPEQSLEPEEAEEAEEAEEHIRLTPEYSQRPVVTSSGTSLPVVFPHQILVQFWNLLQEFLQFLKDKEA
ncbi:acrosin-like [Parus major]|uniref:acrosin-like n=1 Tax=Parus major TaxID=9157 RepID=UPI0014448C79|nr:acrosin-like [Parus major]